MCIYLQMQIMHVIAGKHLIKSQTTLNLTEYTQIAGLYYLLMLGFW